jgi:hypothetical protein
MSYSITLHDHAAARTREPNGLPSATSTASLRATLHHDRQAAAAAAARRTRPVDPLDLSLPVPHHPSPPAAEAVAAAAVLAVRPLPRWRHTGRPRRARASAQPPHGWRAARTAATLPAAVAAAAVHRPPAARHDHGLPHRPLLLLLFSSPSAPVHCCSSGRPERNCPCPSQRCPPHVARPPCRCAGPRARSEATAVQQLVPRYAAGRPGSLAGHYWPRGRYRAAAASEPRAAPPPASMQLAGMAPPHQTAGSGLLARSTADSAATSIC